MARPLKPARLTALAAALAALFIVASAGTASAAPKPTAVTLTSSLNPAVAGSTVSFTAMLSPTVNGGSITFTIDGVAVPNCSAVPMSGLSGFQCNTLLASAGQFTVGASYTGNAAFGAASASLTETVTAVGAPSPTSVGVVIGASPSAINGAPTISYTENGPVTTTVCTIDGATTPCTTSTALLPKLSGGDHTFVVTVTGAGTTATAETSWVINGPTAAKAPAAKPKTKKKSHRHGAKSLRRHGAVA